MLTCVLCNMQHVVNFLLRVNHLVVTYPIIFVFMWCNCALVTYNFLTSCDVKLIYFIAQVTHRTISPQFLKICFFFSFLFEQRKRFWRNHTRQKTTVMMTITITMSLSKFIHDRPRNDINIAAFIERRTRERAQQTITKLAM